MKKNIFLCGYMGVGKSAVGKQLAALLNFEFIDVDCAIVARENKEIENIFKDSGESYFRKIETEVLLELSQKNNAVIAAGGGIVLKDENIENMKNTGMVIFLSASVDTIISRINIKKRPLLKNTPPFELRGKIANMLEERLPRYKLCDIEINTDRKSISETADKIIKYYENKFL